MLHWLQLSRLAWPVKYETNPPEIETKSPLKFSICEVGKATIEYEICKTSHPSKMIYLSPQPRPRNHITTVNISTQKWTCSVVDYLRWDDHFLFQRLHSICATFLAILTRSVEGHIFQYAVYSIDVHQWRRKKSPMLNWIVSDVLSFQAKPDDDDATFFALMQNVQQPLCCLQCLWYIFCGEAVS